MRVTRRQVLAAGVAIVGSRAALSAQQGGQMYGLIGKMTAADGKRDELVAILLDGSVNMPGCVSYVVAKDADDPNGIWITEVWQDQASHDASLKLPAVQQAIGRGRPLIAGFGQRIVTMPVGGQGIR